MLLVTASTLAMLLAVDTGAGALVGPLRRLRVAGLLDAQHRARSCSAPSCSGFSWAHPEARRPAAAGHRRARPSGVAPWLPGLDQRAAARRPLRSCRDLSPFTPSAVWRRRPLDDRLSLLAGSPTDPGSRAAGAGADRLGAACAVGGLIVRRRRGRRAGWPTLRPRGSSLRSSLLLLATPLAEGSVSAVSTHIFGLRNLAASWPALALAFALLLSASGRRVDHRRAAGAHGLACSAAEMVTDVHQRPDYQPAAALSSQRRTGDASSTRPATSAPAADRAGRRPPSPAGDRPGAGSRGARPSVHAV